jgi:hypothetical protein
VSDVAKKMGALLDLAQPATVTDPLNHTTTFGYDAKWREIGVREQFYSHTPMP